MVSERIPRVDVVISARNASRTIGATLASLSAQEFPHFRVLFYDDASNDGTSEVVETWGNAMDMTLLRGAVKQGPGIGRNVAAASGQADLLVFVDADDVVLPNHLTLHVESAERGATITASRVLKWWPDGSHSPGLLLSRVSVPTPHQQWPTILTENFIPGASGVSRSAFESVGGFRGGLMEDWDLWIRLLREGHIARQLRAATYLHRVVPGSRGIAVESESLKEEVLDRAAPLVTSMAERRAMERGRRHLKALSALDRSTAIASAGDTRSARAEAAKALGSPRWPTVLAGLWRVAAPQHRAPGLYGSRVTGGWKRAPFR